MPTSEPKNELQNDPTKNPEKLFLEVYIRSRTKNYFKGKAKTITATNDKGEFDVLPLHTNFVSIVKKYIILDKGLKTEQKFDLDSGVLSVQNDAVDLYIGV